MRRHWAALAVLCVAGCGENAEVAQQPEEIAPAALAPTPESVPDGFILARVRVADLEGAPLAGMRPIATRQPNAFDEPFAAGEPTGADGRAALLIPKGGTAYVRAWDESHTWFANNFYEVIEAPGDRTEEMPITMAESAELTGVILDASGEPVANAEAELVLEHPARGPWWPSRTQTDEHGVAVFAKVPPGEFIVHLRVAETGRVDIPGVRMMPGGQGSFGGVRLIR